MNKEREESIMVLLDTVITLQMAVENLEKLQTTEFNKQKLKQLIKQLIKEVDPIVRINYDRVFNIDEQTTLSIIEEYERIVKNIVHLNIPSKISYGQYCEAWTKDKLKLEETIHEIIKNKL